MALYYNQPMEIMPLQGERAIRQAMYAMEYSTSEKKMQNFLGKRVMYECGIITSTAPEAIKLRAEILGFAVNANYTESVKLMLTTLRFDPNGAPGMLPPIFDHDYNTGSTDQALTASLVLLLKDPRTNPNQAFQASGIFDGIESDWDMTEADDIYMHTPLLAFAEAGSVLFVVALLANSIKLIDTTAESCDRHMTNDVRQARMTRGEKVLFDAAELVLSPIALAKYPEEQGDRQKIASIILAYRENPEATVLALCKEYSIGRDSPLDIEK
jgi:hypothetical protein